LEAVTTEHDEEEEKIKGQVSSRVIEPRSVDQLLAVWGKARYREKAKKGASREATSHIPARINHSSCSCT
jgi:hypothetical protein